MTMPDRVHRTSHISTDAAYAIGELQGDLGALTDFGGRLRVREVSLPSEKHYELAASIGAARMSRRDLVALRDALNLLVGEEEGDA